MDRRPLIVACIPAFNEEKSIAKVIVKALRHVDKVIVCDDGSADMTAEIAEGLGAEVIKHQRNMGYGAALSSLFRRAVEMDPKVIVTLDGDCQHDADEIRRLADPILNGEADIVVGSRFLPEGDKDEKKLPTYREMGIKAITEMTKATSRIEVTDAQSGFRAYSRKALQLVVPMERGMGASAEILMKASELGLRLKEVPVRISYNVEKPSTLNPIYHGLDVISSIVKYVSIRHPLIFYGVPGFSALAIATVLWVWIMQIFAATGEVITNITLIAIGATIMGLVLLTTAILLWALVNIIQEHNL